MTDNTTPGLSKDEAARPALRVRAVFEHLTGPARGASAWLSGDVIDIVQREDRLIEVSEAAGLEAGPETIARLHRAEETYEIESFPSQMLWVNGERVQSRRLEDDDLLEFGENGPLSRYRLIGDGHRLPKSMGDIFKDCADYMKVSRKPWVARYGGAAGTALRDMATQTTLLFRTAVVVVLVALVGTVGYQVYSNIQLRKQVASDALRLESFSRALSRAQREAIQTADLNELRREISRDLDLAGERLAALEERSEASARVIATASQSVVFLQGAYAYRDPASDRLLRYFVDEEGDRLYSPRGQPLLTLDGEGPVAERQFTGTAFVVSDSGALLTNRHVALPWEEDATLEAMQEQGLEPELIRFIGFLPSNQEPFTVALLEVSEEADLAVLTCSDLTGAIPHLGLVDESPNPGDEVIVMGYPTGLRSMLAQTGERFVESLREENDLDFWGVAKRLAAEDFIRPLSSRGIVGQVNEATVVYDAETTHGGSGGPVLDMGGRVVAVNTAIIPEYGGSNFGVPVAYVRRLLEQAGVAL